MDVNEVVLAVVVGVGLGLLLALLAGRRAQAQSRAQAQAAAGEAAQQAVAAAVASVREQATAERDAAVRAAVEHAAVVQRQQLDAGLDAGRRELDAKQGVIDARLHEMSAELRAGLDRLGSTVTQLHADSSRRLGEVDHALRVHHEITDALSGSTRALHEALANHKARGQWGERMADDVLRLAGFVENVNYRRQVQIEGATGLPDFTFLLPKGHVLYMDVKFPMASYLRYLEATTDAERSAHLQAFLRDVRLRVRELARRDYQRAGDAPTVDHVLLFIPNEALMGFIHEHDAGLIDESLRQHVVLCSPLTLFAFLGVIRQAFDNVALEQTSDEILRLLGSFQIQWDKYTDSLALVKKRFDSVQREFDALTTTRRRALERPLRQLDDLRHERGLLPAAEDDADIAADELSA